MPPYAWGPPPTYVAAAPVRTRPRWWVAAAVGLPLGVVLAGLGVVTYFIWFLAIPVLLLGLAAVLTLCFALSPSSPDALAVGLGVIVAVVVGSTLLVVGAVSPLQIFAL